MQSQFNHHTLPVTPFYSIIIFRKPLKASHPTDNSIEDAVMHIIWSHGQSKGVRNINLSDSYIISKSYKLGTIVKISWNNVNQFIVHCHL